jgi:peroxiredoxin
MEKKRLAHFILIIGVLTICAPVPMAFAISEAYKGNIYQVGTLKPIDSVLKLKVGERAPNFTLPSVSGEKVSLSQFQGKKNVVLSFVPAAWTPVCSDQWPGYNIAKDIFNQYDTILLGITVDNIPTLFHGAVAKGYGVLRSDGLSERALFVIDKKGIIRYIDVHDINKRPPLEDLVNALEKVGK